MTSYVVPNLDQTVSTVNSTTTPLAGSATFTGTSEDVSSYASISIICKSDVAGTLTLQFSNDGTNWDVVNTYIVSAGSGLDFVKVVTAKYYRVTYINGASAQTYFRLQSIAHVSKAVPPIDSSTTSGVVSSYNNTTTPLVAAAVYTGIGEIVTNYSTATTNVYSDVDGVVEIQLSSDGTNYDISHSTTIIGGRGFDISTLITAKYIRVKYTNGSTNQTTFRLQTIFHVSKSVTLNDIASATVSTGYTMTTDLAESLVSANSNRKTLIISVTGYDVFIRLMPSATDNATRKGIFLPINSTITLSGPDIYKGAVSCFNSTNGETPKLYVTEY